MKNKQSLDYLEKHIMVETNHAYQNNPLFLMLNSNLIQYKLELESLLKHFECIYQNLNMNRQILLVLLLLKGTSSKKTKGHKPLVLLSIISTFLPKLIQFFLILVSTKPPIDENNLLDNNIFGGFQ